VTTRYEADYAGIGQLMRSDAMLGAVTEVARNALEYAESISPVGKPPGDHHPGMYKAGWRLETSSAGGPAHDRAEARIINDALDEVLADVVDGHDIPARVLSYIEDSR
jgi:hypothetical protein